MAISIDFGTLVISVPQADLTLIGGTLYELETETVFRAAVNAIMDNEEGIPFDDPIRHNTEVTVAGTTFARTIEVINGYSVTFTPDTQWSVRLAGSNNNLFDVENGILNQNQVQVIAQNSAGLIGGRDAFIEAVFTRVLENGETFEEAMRLVRAESAGKVAVVGAQVRFRDAADTKDRIDATTDANGQRTAVTVDGS